MICKNDFISGTLGTPQAEAIVPKVVEKINEYQSDLNADNEVVFTLDTHNGETYLNTLEGKNLPVCHCLKDNWGWKLHDKLYGYEFRSKCFKKDTFGSTACAEYVRNGVYDMIEIVGLCTDVCVISNALLLKTFSPQTRIVVDSSCCAGTTPLNHIIALKAMELCQIEIIS